MSGISNRGIAVILAEYLLCICCLNFLDQYLILSVSETPGLLMLLTAYQRIRAQLVFELALLPVEVERDA